MCVWGGGWVYVCVCVCVRVCVSVCVCVCVHGCMHLLGECNACLCNVEDSAWANFNVTTHC